MERTGSEAQTAVRCLVPETVAPLQTGKLVGDNAAAHRSQQPIRQRILGQNASVQVQIDGISTLTEKTVALPMKLLR